MRIKYLFLISLMFNFYYLGTPEPINKGERKFISIPKEKKFPLMITKIQKRCLDLNVYHEARGENIRGQMAVAVVTLNRTLSNKFPNSICRVVKQGYHRGSRSCAFSWYCNFKSDSPKNKIAWEKTRKISENVIENYLNLSNNFSATYYHANYIKPPYWTKKLKRSTTIGNHIFYSY